MGSFFKDLTSIGISKVAVIAFSLASGIITARWLGPEGNGIIATLSVYPSIFLTFGALGVSQSATHLIGSGKYNEDSIKSSIVQIWLVTAIFCVVACFWLIREFSNSGENLVLVAIAVLPIPFTLFNKYNSGIFLGKNQIGMYARINWLPRAMTFLVTVLLIVVLALGVKGAMVAMVAGPLIMSILLLVKNDFHKFFKLIPEMGIIRNMLSLGVIYALSLLAINLNYKLDVIMLDKLSVSYETGIYSKGVALADFLWEIPMLLSTIVFARSASAEDGLRFSKKVVQLLRLSLVFIGAAAILLVILARFIVIYMYGSDFEDSGSVIQILVPGVVLLTIFKVLNMDLAGKGKPLISMKAMIPALILNVLLNIFFIPQYGANGAAIASLCSYSFAAVLFLYFYVSEVGLSVKEVFAYKKSDFYVVKEILNKLKKG
jgi:O-antigen/teichoic acid export membrane protein